MRLITIVFTLFLSVPLWADSIQSYMKISNNIPQMEIKADAQSQAYARSARQVLTITSESIAETMIEANFIAKEHTGKSLFCLPAGTTLNAKLLDAIIKQSFSDQQSQQQPSSLDRESVSKIAWSGVLKKFPCDKATNNQTQQMSHLSALLNR